MDTRGEVVLGAGVLGAERRDADSPSAPSTQDPAPPAPHSWRLPPDDALKAHLLDAQPLCPDCRLPFDEKARLQFARLALDPERARGSTWWHCAGCGRPVCARLTGIAYRLT